MKKRHHKAVVRPAKTSWGAVASRYHATIQEDDSYQQALILPNLRRVLGAVNGMKLLDIGCGEGFFARALAEVGAKVSGADIAPEMIEVARKKSPPAIRYEVAPSHKMPFESKAFDAAIIILAIQNIEKMAETFAECARLLAKGGTLVVVMNHPSFRIPKRTAWQWDQAKGIQFRRVDGYMSTRQERLDMDPGRRDNKRFTYSFHRPLENYAHALMQSGFVISGLEEWVSHRHSAKGPRAAAEDAAREEFPMFLMLQGLLLKGD